MWSAWRGAAPVRASALRHARASCAVLQQRAFWGDAAGLISRMRPSAALHADVLAEQSASASAARDATSRRALHELSRAIRKAKSAKQLSAIWAVLAQHRPFYVHRGMVRFFEPTADGNEAQERTGDEQHEDLTKQYVLRVVPMAELLQREQDGTRSVVVERAPWFTGAMIAEDSASEASEGDDVVAEDGVVLVGETFVARKLVVALERLGDHDALVLFVETLEAARRQFRTLELLQTQDEQRRAVVTAMSAIGGHIDAMYVAALGRQRATTKIVKRCELHREDLSRFIFDRNAFRSLLTACAIERHGALARAALDQALDRFPLTTFNVRLYTCALHANLRAEPKTADRLEDALHIYRRMVNDAGYILAPPEWSMLFNASVYLDNHAAALDVFANYRVHGIAPFRSRFQQALRTACKFQRFDTAIAMAEAWIQVEADAKKAQPEPSSRSDAHRAAETECLNKILWEMLKTEPTLEQVKAVLRLMQVRQTQAGALVIRRIVTRFLRDPTGKKRADESAAADMVKRLLKVWEACPDVIQRTGFVLYLILEQCEANDWSEQCEAVVEYGIAQGTELPMQSAVKILERYASRGEFDRAIQLGELILRRGGATSTKLTDQFFETLLKSYLFRQQFDAVVELDDALDLATRFPQNPVLAAIVRDARSMIV